MVFDSLLTESFVFSRARACGLFRHLLCRGRTTLLYLLLVRPSTAVPTMNITLGRKHTESKALLATYDSSPPMSIEYASTRPRLQDVCRQTKCPVHRAVTNILKTCFFLASAAVGQAPAGQTMRLLRACIMFLAISGFSSSFKPAFIKATRPVSKALQATTTPVIDSDAEAFERITLARRSTKHFERRAVPDELLKKV